MIRDDVMRKKFFVVLTGVIALLILITTGAVDAHHAFSAEFDASKPVVLRGKSSKRTRRISLGCL